MDPTQARIQTQSEDRTVQSDLQGQQQVQLADSQGADHPRNDAGTLLQSVQHGQQQVQQGDAENHREVCQNAECTCGSLTGHKNDKRTNILPIWGDQTTMNLNAKVLENIKKRNFYKKTLMEFDSFQTLVDQIVTQVKHLEPFENCKRWLETNGTCGGVRDVKTGGVVSSAYCLLYRLFNLRITRKQLISMLNSRQSVYIRGIGFMYIHYTQPPADLWYWLEPYLDDDSEIDPRSGGGDLMSFGQMVTMMIKRHDWYGTLFPKIPDQVQKEIDEKFAERRRQQLAEEETRQGDGEGTSTRQGYKSNKGKMIWTCTGCRIQLPPNEPPQLHAIQNHGMKEGKLFSCSCCNSIFSLPSAKRLHKKYMTNQQKYSDTVPLLHCSKPKGWNQRSQSSNLTGNHRQQEDIVQREASLETGTSAETAAVHVELLQSGKDVGNHTVGENKALESTERVESTREKSNQENVEDVKRLEESIIRAEALLYTNADVSTIDNQLRELRRLRKDAPNYDQTTKSNCETIMEKLTEARKTKTGATKRPGNGNCQGAPPAKRNKLADVTTRENGGSDVPSTSSATPSTAPSSSAASTSCAPPAPEPSNARKPGRSRKRV